MIGAVDPSPKYPPPFQAFLWVLVSRWLASIVLDGDDGDSTGTGTSDVGIGDSQAVLEWVADGTKGGRGAGFLG